LSLGEVRLWCVGLRSNPNALARLSSVLETDEADRANRFRFPEHRDHFLTARGLLRFLLGDALGVAPNKLRFLYGARGKPRLAFETPLRFNLSHSGSLVLYAFALDRELGVDVEQHREMTDLERVARRFFAVKEVADLLSLAAEERSTAFFRCWTRKESFVKAVGDGLYIPLDSFCVSLLANEPAAIENGPAGTTEQWILTDVTPQDGYAAALTTEGKPARLTAFRSTDASGLLELLSR
jgi:4'-phosphopantetheinyl transferase